MPLLRDLTFACCLTAGALGASQVPRFAQEYEQRLGGALQEVTRQEDAFRRVAAADGVDLAVLVARLHGAPEGATRRLAATIGETTARRQALALQAEWLAAVGWLGRPLVVLRHADLALLRATWAVYRPSLTLDAAFGAAGAFLGWLLNGAAWSLAGVLRRRRLHRGSA